MYYIINKCGKLLFFKASFFMEVNEAHAYKEGEGDRSLAYWRKVHEEAFTKEWKEIKMTFSEDSWWFAKNLCWCIRIHVKKSSI